MEIDILTVCRHKVEVGRIQNVNVGPVEILDPRELKQSGSVSTVEIEPVSDPPHESLAIYQALFGDRSEAEVCRVLKLDEVLVPHLVALALRLQGPRLVVLTGHESALYLELHVMNIDEGDWKHGQLDVLGHNQELVGGVGMIYSLHESLRVELLIVWGLDLSWKDVVICEARGAS